MSPALLSKRLRTLTQAGVVERREHGGRVSYVLTDAGAELRPVVEALGQWGTRWVPGLGDADLDPRLVLWDIHRGLDLSAMPGERTVIEFRLDDAAAGAARWWIVVDGAEVDVCDSDPGHEVTVTLESPLRVLVALWRGDIDWAAASRSGLRIEGPAWARRALPRWMRLSPFAATPRPA